MRDPLNLPGLGYWIETSAALGSWSREGPALIESSRADGMIEAASSRALDAGAA
ncbi:MAG: hypothetical protein R3F11_26955 [Verrucomicrobiales bacterium]